MEYLKIESHPDLVKDKKSMAISNTDIAKLSEYKKQKSIITNIDTLKSEVSFLKDHISDLYSMKEDIKLLRTELEELKQLFNNR